MSDAIEFPHTFVINLDERQDRWAHISRLCEAANIPIERVSATKAKPGWVGCGNSHLECLRRGAQRGLPWILVLEDDALFTPADINRFRMLLPLLWTMQGEWDVFNGGPTLIWKPEPKILDKENNLVLIQGLCTHFMLYQKHVFDSVQHWDPPLNQEFDIFLYKQGFGQDATVRMAATTPAIATQYVDKSDIHTDCDTHDQNYLFAFANQRMLDFLHEPNWVGKGNRCETVNAVHRYWTGEVFLERNGAAAILPLGQSRAHYSKAPGVLVMRWYWHPTEVFVELAENFVSADYLVDYLNEIRSTSVDERVWIYEVIHPEWSAKICLLPSLERVVRLSDGRAGSYNEVRKVLEIEWDNRSKECFVLRGARYEFTLIEAPPGCYRVALLVDEFFGGWDTAIGGYGALARKYICRLVPNNKIRIDVLLDSWGGERVSEKLVDQTVVYRLPGDPGERQTWLDEQAFDLFLSIEMTLPSFEILKRYKTTKTLLYWIQDPRDLDMYQSRLKTISKIRDGDWGYLTGVTEWMQELIEARRVRFASQGVSLSAIAREMYQIPCDMPIFDLPNPVEIDYQYNLDEKRETDKIIFLGRIEAQKRAWIFCELAKNLPNYQFYVLGATGRGRDETGNARSLELYRNSDGSSKVSNLHFVGHVDGDIKNEHIKSAKILVNTSIGEGIPVSWLEALSYGTLIVSSFDRDDIVTRFGSFVGEVLGDGIDQVSIANYACAIEYWMTHELERRARAKMAIAFVKERHSIDAFVEKMRRMIVDCISSSELPCAGKITRVAADKDPAVVELGFKSVMAKHSDWTGRLLLSEHDDTVIHDGVGSRGRYLRKGERLVVNWEEFAPDEFVEVDGILIQRTIYVGLGGKSSHFYDRDECFESAVKSLLSFAYSPEKRRDASLAFDARLGRYIGDSNLLPRINCFYEVLQVNGGNHSGLVAAITSMRAAGHPVRLWTYSPERLNFILSEGVELAPAAQVVPEALFERVVASSEIRYFSDVFRYALLYELGGVWMDTDIVLLRPFNYNGAYFLNLQWTAYEHRICNNVLVAPPRSLYFRHLYEAALDRLHAPGARGFGEIGPLLLTAYVFSDAGTELRNWVFSPMCFNAIDWSETELFDRPLKDLSVYLNDERVVGIHLWNAKTESKQKSSNGSVISILANTRESLPSLVELAECFNTDKNRLVGNRHFYSRIYQYLLAPRRLAVRQLMEIGVYGGPLNGRKENEIPSVDLWLRFFPFCSVIGVDIEDLSRFHNPRFVSHLCDQSDPVQVAHVAASIDPGSLDVIVDDGSHASYDQQMTFRFFFSRLAPGGWYFIEDLDWQPSGGNPDRVALTKNVFAALRDGDIGALPDPEGLATLRKEMDQILFFDSHFELCSRGLRGGLLAVQRRIDLQ